MALIIPEFALQLAFLSIETSNSKAKADSVILKGIVTTPQPKLGPEVSLIET